MDFTAPVEPSPKSLSWNKCGSYVASDADEKVGELMDHKTLPRRTTTLSLNQQMNVDLKKLLGVVSAQNEMIDFGAAFFGGGANKAIDGDAPLPKRVFSIRSCLHFSIIQL